MQLPDLLAWWRRRREERRRRVFRAGNGDVCCPYCGTWQSEASSLPERLTFITGPGQTDFLECAQCGEQSEWLFGPGVWIGISKKSLKEVTDGKA